MTVTGLSADTAYYYGIEVDGVVDTEYGGSFSTAPTPGTPKSFTFCAASCASNNSNATTFDAIRAENPSFFVHLGDLHYRDLTSNDQIAYQRAYDQVMSSPRQLAFFGALPVPYIWSDHDSVGANGDGTAASVPAANAVYRSRVPAYGDMPAVTGTYFSWTWGRVRFVCTDGRSFMSPIAQTDDASKTKLGSTQKAWLLDQLTDPTYPLIIWCHEDAISNGLTFVGDDTWSAYSTERQEIFDAIAAAGTNVAYICGDLHSLAADDGTNVPAAGANSGVPVHVAAAMDNTSFKGNGVYTAGTYPATDGVLVNHYGLFTITDTGSQISLAFAGKDAGGVTRVSQTTTWTLSTPQNATPSGSAGAVQVRASAGAVTAVRAAPIAGGPGAVRVRAPSAAVQAVQNSSLPARAGAVRLAPSTGAVLAVQEAPVAGVPGSVRVRASAGAVLSVRRTLPAGLAGAVRLRASAGAVLGEQVAAVSGGPGSVRLHGAPGGVATVQQAFPAAGGGRVVIRASAGAVSTAVGGTSVTVGGRAGGVLLRAAQATVLAVQEQPVTGAPGALTVRPGAGAVLAVQRQTPAGVAGVVRLSAGSARVLAVQSAVPAGAAGVIRVRGGAGALAGPVTVVLQGTAASIWCRPGRGSVLAGGTPTVTRGAMTAAARTGAQAVRRERAGARMGGR
nr:alkaline phosphatase D family protein [Microbispora sp. CL1-1]